MSFLLYIHALDIFIHNILFLLFVSYIFLVFIPFFIWLFINIGPIFPFLSLFQFIILVFKFLKLLLTLYAQKSSTLLYFWLFLFVWKFQIFLIYQRIVYNCFIFLCIFTLTLRSLFNISKLYLFFHSIVFSQFLLI